MPSRTRETGGFVNQARRVQSIAFNGSTVSDVTDYPSALVTGDYTVTNDVVTPKFRQRISRGEIINNPFHSDHLVRTASYTPFAMRANSGSGSQVRDYFGDKGYGFPIVGAPDPTLIDVDSLVTLAGTAAHAGVLQPDLQGLVEVAEFHKTMELFRVRTGYLNRHLDSILRFAQRKGKLRKGINFFSDNWLKYRYGIMPLVNSAETALLELGKVRSKRQRSVATEKESKSGTNTTVNNSGAYWNCSFTHMHHRVVSVLAGVLYEYTGSYNELGFRATDIPSAMWELIPYSFVADWAANVGDYIQAVTPKVNANVLASWVSIQNEYSQTTHASASWKSVSNWTELSRPSGVQSWVHTVKERRPMAPIGLAFRPNALKKPSAPKRVIDAIALTAQLLKGRAPSGARL